MSLLTNSNDICVVYEEGLKKLGFSATALLLLFRFSEKRNEILPSIAYHWDFCGRNFNIIKAKCEKNEIPGFIQSKWFTLKYQSSDYFNFKI